MARTAVFRLRPSTRLRLADDVLSDAMLGLVKASIDYNEDRGPFRQYASLRIHFEIGDGLRRIGFSVHAARRTKLLPTLASGIVLPSGDDPAEEMGAIDYGNPDGQDDVDRRLSAQQTFACLDRWAFCLLPQQKQVYDLFRTGVSQVAIGRQMGITESRVSQIMRAIRARLLAEHAVQAPWEVSR